MRVQAQRGSAVRAAWRRARSRSSGVSTSQAAWAATAMSRQLRGPACGALPGRGRRPPVEPPHAGRLPGRQQAAVAVRLRRPGRAPPRCHLARRPARRAGEGNLVCERLVAGDQYDVRGSRARQPRRESRDGAAEWGLFAGPDDIAGEVARFAHADDSPMFRQGRDEQGQHWCSANLRGCLVGAAESAGCAAAQHDRRDPLRALSLRHDFSLPRHSSGLALGLHGGWRRERRIA